MVGHEPGGLEYARVRLACGRIAAGARGIAQSHSFGIPEGPHERPWTKTYHREAVHVYAESLPPSYQRDVAALFGQSADAMDRQHIPARLAQHWVIVTAYLRNASAAIEQHLDTLDMQPQRPEPAQTPAIDGPPPMVIRYDALARLTALRGVSLLEEAALAVQRHMDAPVPTVLSQAERHLLQRVAAGVRIVDLAAELGYSRRSMFRELRKLWTKLGVADRSEGIAKAGREGLFG